MAAEDTYLDLSVGPFGLALAARSVVMVRQDVPAAPAVDVGDATVPFCDLWRVFGGAQRAEVPFLIVIECGSGLAAVGVDRVGHLRRRDLPTLRHVPAFGLTHPSLFAGGVQDAGRLLLVLDPAALVALTLGKARPI